MHKNDVAFNSLLDMPAIFVVWLPTKQRMADNGWMYSGRVSVTTRSDEWMWKTRMLVKELARGKRIAELCPCSRCNKRHRQGRDEMYTHLTRSGYMLGYVPPIDFAKRERDRYDVLRQRLNGNEYDGIRNFLDDLIHADLPDSPPPREEPPELEEPPEQEEPEPTAKAYYAMIEAAKKPLYPNSPMSIRFYIVAKLLLSC